METVTDSYAGEAPRAPGAAQPQEAAYGAGAGIPSSQDRMIIQTATLSVVVQDTAASMDAIRAIVQGMEGYVSASSASYSGEQLYGHMTVRVPAGELDGALEQIKALAQRVQNEDTSGQDVTEEFTDLSARLLNLEATETELRELLASVRERTGKAEDILAVYRELTQIRGEIEQIRAQCSTCSA